MNRNNLKAIQEIINDLGWIPIIIFALLLIPFAYLIRLTSLMAGLKNGLKRN